MKRPFIALCAFALAVLGVDADDISGRPQLYRTADATTLINPYILAGGGAAASGYFDIDATLDVGSDWAQTGTAEYIDTTTRQPTAPSTASYIAQWAAADEYVVSADEISGSVTNLRVWVYGSDYGIEDVTRVDVTADGSTWDGYVTLALPHSDAGWASVDFDVSWSGTSDFRIRFNKVTTSWNNSYFYAVYAEANP